MILNQEKLKIFSSDRMLRSCKSKIRSSLPMQECGNNSDIYDIYNDYRIQWSIITSLLESMGVGLPRYDCKPEWVKREPEGWPEMSVV